MKKSIIANEEMTVAEFNRLDGEMQMKRAKYIATVAAKELCKTAARKKGGIRFQTIAPMIDDAATDGIIACLECNTPDKLASVVITNTAQQLYRHEYYILNRDAESIDDDESAARLDVMAAKIPGPESIVIAREMIDRVIAELPVKYQKRARAVYNGLYAGYTAKEIAAALKLSDQTVWNMMQTLKASAATIRAIDCDGDALELVIDSDRRSKDNQATRDGWTKK